LLTDLLSLTPALSSPGRCNFLSSIIKMKELFYFLKRELVSVVLILVSFVFFFLIGALLDILLTHFYANIKNEKAVLPPISQWVFESMAGHRFLPQEIMACIWIFMVLLLSRLEETGMFDRIIHIILLLELILINFIPFGLVVWRKVGRAAQQTELKS